MTCAQAHDRLAELAPLSGDDALPQDLARHLQSCERCREHLYASRQMWDELAHWPEQEMPAELVRTVATRARAEAKTADSPLAVALIFGLVAALVSAFVISSRVSLDHVPPLGLVGVGAVWTVLYSGLFFLFRLAREHQRAVFFVTRAVLVAGGMFLLLSYLSPVPASITFCSRYYVTQPLLDRISIAATYFLFGGVYAGLPMAIAAYLTPGPLRENTAMQGTLAGGMFALLLTPGIIMQCAPFAFGVLIGWFTGALLGSVLGGMLGFWLRARIA